MLTTGERIRKLRELRGYSQEYMASKLSISQEQYSYLETKQKKITDKNIKTIISLLGVTATYFEDFDPDRFLQNRVPVKEKLTIKDFMGRNNNSEREAYLELITRLKKELRELKKEIRILKSNSNKYAF